VPAPFLKPRQSSTGATNNTPQQLNAGDGLSPASWSALGRAQARTVHTPLYHHHLKGPTIHAEQATHLSACFPEGAGRDEDTYRLPREKRMAAFRDHRQGGDGAGTRVADRRADRSPLDLSGREGGREGGRCYGGVVAFSFVQPTMGTLRSYLAKWIVFLLVFLSD